MAIDTVQLERDLRQAKKALKRLTRDWKKVTKDIGKRGGVLGLCVPRGTPVATDGCTQPKVSPSLRQMRELKKALDTFRKEVKYLEAEIAAATITEKEKTDDYAL